MKRLLTLLLIPVILILLTSCGNSVVITEPDSEYESRVQKVYPLQSDDEMIAVEDGRNYILLTMANGRVAKAEYAYKFGTPDFAQEMLDYYEENGFDPQYTTGRVESAYLILTYAENNKYIGLTEQEIQLFYGENITPGYFTESVSE